jgi:hypothetical protein
VPRRQERLVPLSLLNIFLNIPRAGHFHRVSSDGPD